MCWRVRPGALTPPCRDHPQKADMFAVPISCCRLLPSIYDAIPSPWLHWFCCRVSRGPSQSWHHSILWRSLLSYHNNYIPGTVWLQPIHRGSIQRHDLYLGVVPFAVLWRPALTCPPELPEQTCCMLGTSASFPWPPPASWFVGQRAHVAAPRGIGIY